MKRESLQNIRYIGIKDLNGPEAIRIIKSLIEDTAKGFKIYMEKEFKKKRSERKDGGYASEGMVIVNQLIFMPETEYHGEVQKMEERQIKPERMDYMEKGAAIGKPRTYKK